MKNLFLKISLISLIAFSSAFSNPGKDNKQLLMELKDCCMTVVKDNLALIETNKDGSRKSKGITPAGFTKESYRVFNALHKDDKQYVQSLSGNYDTEQLAEALATFLAATRIAIAKVQKKINTDADGTINPKKFYPAVFGRLTANEFEKRTGIKIKQTTTGKGMGARNTKYNKPDAWEKSALAKIEADGWNIKEGVFEESDQICRYLHPLEIKKACLSCHGDPRGEKDISGHTKEGYKLGEIRGGISVLIPKKVH